MRYLTLFVSFFVVCSSCSDQNTASTAAAISTKAVALATDATFAKNELSVSSSHTPHKPKPLTLPNYDSLFTRHADFKFEGFDFPVGKPNADNYFKAVKFGQRLHLGEDWNGIHGGNSDLGDPVYSMGHGYVSVAEHFCCGWGNVVRVVHQMPVGHEYQYTESVYAHLHNMQVRVGDFVKRGEQIGTIGTADGKYSAHLHLELRSFIGMSIGPGYSKDNFGYLNPTPFIEQHRPR